MKQSILLIAFVAVAVPVFAWETPADREWREVRRQLEKDGVRVDHFAKTPAERELELRRIRQQLEQKNDPTRSQGKKSFGGAAGGTAVKVPSEKKVQPAKGLHK